jgi:hypothetical protein
MGWLVGGRCSLILCSAAGQYSLMLLFSERNALDPNGQSREAPGCAGLPCEVVIQRPLLNLCRH